jgi:hypothetical protein
VVGGLQYNTQPGHGARKRRISPFFFQSHVLLFLCL